MIKFDKLVKSRNEDHRWLDKKPGIDFVAAQQLWDDTDLLEIPAKQRMNLVLWSLA